MKQFFAKILSTIQSPEGEISSKRVFGIACLIQAVIISFVSGDIALTGLWLGTGATVFGIQAITKT
jgi:hypothetical protein